MSLKDEDLVLLKYADEKTFNSLRSENLKVEHEKLQKDFIAKISLFLLLLLSNGYIFFFKGYAQYFFSQPSVGFFVNGNPASFLSIFILGAIFIWLPSNILTRLGKMNFESSTSSGSNMTVTPVLAFRLFGWVIFALPTMIFLISTI